jgi:acetoin utilization protein AcuB
MTEKVITTAPDCPIEEAARTLHSNRIGALPVLRNNRLVGIITESDIFDAFLSMTAAKNNGARIMVASDSGTNPVPAVLELSRQHHVDLLSLFSFRENRLKRRDMSIFRFGGRLPPGFLHEIASRGFRIVSVERRER